MGEREKELLEQYVDERHYYYDVRDICIEVRDVVRGWQSYFQEVHAGDCPMQLAVTVSKIRRVVDVRLYRALADMLDNDIRYKMVCDDDLTYGDVLSRVLTEAEDDLDELGLLDDCIPGQRIE